jgi:hypothetical protein
MMSEDEVKVYVVIVTSIDGMHGIVGVFSNRKKAEEAVNRWNTTVQRITELCWKEARPTSEKVNLENLESVKFRRELEKMPEFEEAYMIENTEANILEYKIDEFKARTW